MSRDEIQHEVVAGSQFQPQLAQPRPKAVPISKSALPITTFGHLRDPIRDQPSWSSASPASSHYQWEPHWLYLINCLPCATLYTYNSTAENSSAWRVPYLEGSVVLGVAQCGLSAGMIYDMIKLPPPILPFTQYPRSYPMPSFIFLTY
jgi:hypothetical protein